jgi:hypothetical protein
MARATDHTARKRAAEAEFHYHVDVPLLGGLGRLRTMLNWCGAHVAAGAWDMRRHCERRKGARSLEYARFYFTTDADAEAFSRRWAQTALNLDA